MASSKKKVCLVNIDQAQIYCEIAGGGTPFVMIHAAVADSRQWENEFLHFARDYRVLRYDARGFGKSEPVEGDYSDMRDLLAIMDSLLPHEPSILMGCSRGGQLALDVELDHPERVKALILVGCGPSGLDLDIEESPKNAQAEQAWKDGDIDRTAELETQIWFDGSGRTPEQVDPQARKLAYDMDRLALSHDVRNLGKRLPNSDKPAFDRLGDLKVPLLLVVGEYDEPYILAASEYIATRVTSARRVVMKNAAHLPNMEHPEEFRRIVEEFLSSMQ